MINVFCIFDTTINDICKKRCVYLTCTKAYFSIIVTELTVLNMTFWIIISFAKY
jgi:hypothetical protein